ncbi:hypothetical protein GF359_07195 [candidate division WOR-3 bacterium]|uniref:Transglutaminase-like domain-containing protein n=1 Tax=candidate division WOR-3 bacterium TaxID=2052148 RepID=A0A9D5KAA5_UNCW3|nr:hypothetical protein [candidate division WOR-3 bacterium]MBD3364985.1 hypothetical protein [candidate division WOR-3 bacterium]
MYKRILPVLVLLLACGSGKHEAAQFEPTEGIVASEDWMGMYIKDAKIGYLYSRQEILDSSTLRFTQKSVMKLEMLGSHEEFSTNMIAETDTNYNLITFTSDISSRQTTFYAEGYRDEDLLIITVESAGTKETKEIPIEGEGLITPALGKWVLAKNPQPGDKFKVTIFEPTLLRFIPVTVKTIGPEAVEIDDEKIPAMHFKTTLLAMTNDVWLDSTGSSLKEIQKPKILAIRESRTRALAEIPAPVQLDLLSFFAVQPDKPIENPRGLSRIKLLVSGIPPEVELSLSSETQGKIDLPEGIELTITLPDTSSMSGSPLPLTEPAEFLGSSIYIQKDNEKIRNKALEIVGDEKDAVTAAAKLVDWVHNNLTKRATASVPSAVEVLATRQGDCNEHAILTAALGRAAGIPTKINVGLVYLDGAFYYHAWNSFWTGDTWVPADATFGQLPADPTHIQLHEGELDEQAKVLAIVGQIGIQILEAR